MKIGFLPSISIHRSIILIFIGKKYACRLCSAIFDFHFRKNPFRDEFQAMQCTWPTVLLTDKPSVQKLKGKGGEVGGGEGGEPTEKEVDINVLHSTDKNINKSITNNVK